MKSCPAEESANAAVNPPETPAGNAIVLCSVSVVPSKSNTLAAPLAVISVNWRVPGPGWMDHGLTGSPISVALPNTTPYVWFGSRGML